MYIPSGACFSNKHFSLRAGQDFEDAIDRDDMFVYPSDDDLELEVLAFADGHPPTEIYVVDHPQDVESETDIMVLYSAKELSQTTYPKPAKSRPAPYQSTPISLIAYQGDETRSVFLDYPYTAESDLNATLDSIIPDRLTLTRGVTGLRNDPNFIYHRCSSTAGSSGGALANENGGLVGIASSVSFALMIGIHVEGEYNGDGVVDWTCENVGIALDSPALRNFIEHVIVPIVAPECRDAWVALLQD